MRSEPHAPPMVLPKAAAVSFQGCSFLFLLMALLAYETVAQASCGEFHLNCTACTANVDCRFCPADGYCSGLENDAVFFPFRCITEVEFVANNQSCSSDDIYRPRFDGNIDGQNGPFFRDPNYSVMGWVFDMINVLPVWREGLTGAGVRVRINDSGMNYEHVEFSNRFDANASCDAYYGVEDPKVAGSGARHGTLVASVVGAEANNDHCGVGIAPGVTLSACTVSSDSVDIFEQKYLDEKLDMFDISQNSYGNPNCFIDGRVKNDDGMIRRWLQQTSCPFNTELINNSFENPCAVCDFAVTSHLDLSDACRSSIRGHCSAGNYLYRDPHACRDFIDVFADDGRSCQVLSDDDAVNIVSGLKRGAKEGRNGKGIIFVFASGNNALHGANTNSAHFTFSRYTIPVGGVGQDGIIAAYSVPGSNLLVSAPSGNGYDANKIEMVGAGIYGGTECRSVSAGTSFSAPVVSGVIALMLEANQNLSYRDVQGILATTSRVPGYINRNDAEEVGFETSAEIPPTSLVEFEDTITNAGGYTHSYDYGFGIIDAHAAVVAAKNWTSYGEEISIFSSSDDIHEIVDDPDVWVSSTVHIKPSGEATGEGIGFFIEHVEVVLGSKHASRGDLLIMLTSPSGTISRLAPGNRNEDNNGAKPWVLTTVRSWGESPYGVWKLRIRDVSQGKFLACEENPWAPPPFENGCGVVSSFRSGCKVLGINSSAFRTTPDANGETANSACCRCGGGNREGRTCRSKPWTFDLGNRSCDIFNFASRCPIQGITDAIMDTVFEDVQQSARESCCMCGGGFRPKPKEMSNEILKGWNITVFGHAFVNAGDPILSPAFSPTSSPTSTPSTISSTQPTAASSVAKDAIFSLALAALVCASVL